MATLYSIDPGLDYVVAARWDVRTWRRSPRLEECAKRFLGLAELRTDAADPLPFRLRQISAWAAGLAAEGMASGGAHFVIEEPAKAGGYARNRKKQRTQTDPGAALNQAYLFGFGALLGGIPHAHRGTLELVTDHHKKDWRRSVVDRVLPVLRARNADVHDAAYFGLTALSTWP